MFNHVDGTDLGESGIAEGVGKAVEVGEDIGAGVGIAVEADCAGEFVDAASDVEDGAGRLGLSGRKEIVSRALLFCGLRLRSSELLLLGYFLYSAALTVAFGLGAASVAKACVVLVVAGAFFLWMGRFRGGGSVLRDWAPPLVLLAAYRELELFAHDVPGHPLEQGWQAIDRVLLNGWHLRAAIESAGWLLPLYFELTYLLVYGIGFFLVLAVFRARRRDIAHRVLFVYLLGALLAYAIIPFFPSAPTRSLYTDSDPTVMTPLRRLNLLIVNDADVHTGVFPSAHVSSAFAAAWALLLLVKERRREGWGMLVYAVSVAIGTIYGRYHYAVDAIAGFAVSLAAIAWVQLQKARTA